MEKLNTPILIVLIILSIGTIFKIFQFDSHTKEILKELNEAEAEVENAQKLNAEAQIQLKDLQRKVESFELKNNLLVAERDSLVLAKKRKSAKDWKELQEIKDKQKKNMDKIKELREKDNKFE